MQSDKTSTAQKFLEIYNELDRFMRSSLHFDNSISHKQLIAALSKENRIIAQNYQDLYDFAELRNAIVHNHYPEAEPIAEPHIIIVQKYEGIKNAVIYPLKTINKALKFSAIFTATEDDNVLEIMKVMNLKNFTYIPVVCDFILRGVFSENVIFSFLATQSSFSFSGDFKIKDFSDFFPIDKHSGEYFSFVSKDKSYIETVELFEKGYKNRKRLAVIFITENGIESEPLLGMINAWDVFSLK